MSDPSLVELWAVVEGWLRTARNSLSISSSETAEPLVHFEHYLSHNEFELALDALFEAGECSQQTHRFWDAMCQAAAHMKLP